MRKRAKQKNGGISRPQSSRWMALDVGSKTIGLALSDELKLTARPLTTIPRVDLESDRRRLLQLVRRWQVDRLVVGLPRHMDGRESENLEWIRPLAESLAAEGLKVQWCDERLSTREADELMAQLKLPLPERRQRRNEFAAAVILKWYLEENPQP